MFFILLVILKLYTKLIDTIVKQMQKKKQMESIYLKKSVIANKPILHNGAKMIHMEENWLIVHINTLIAYMKIDLSSLRVWIIRSCDYYCHLFRRWWKENLLSKLTHGRNPLFIGKLLLFFYFNFDLNTKSCQDETQVYLWLYKRPWCFV